MIESLTVQNLGCFNDQEHTVKFTEETVLVGPNNSGKSIFISGINIIRYSIIRGFTWSTDSFNFINGENAVYNHDLRRAIIIKMKINGNEYIFDYSGPRGLNLLRDGESFRVSEVDQNIMKNIWFIRPNRNVVPYSSVVQPTGTPLQPINPDGSNITNYLLERFTEQDQRWDMANEWLKKLDHKISSFRTPLRGGNTYLELMINGNIPINMTLQGSGLQSAITVISSLIFSPEGSTIILEETKAYLHSNSQDMIVDLINYVVNKNNKQVIFSTHSWDIINDFAHDVGRAGDRGSHHEKADSRKFSLITFTPTEDTINIGTYDLRDKIYIDARNYFKGLWG